MTRILQTRGGVPESGRTDPRTWALKLNFAMAGKTDNVGLIEGLSLASLPLVVTDGRVGIGSFIGLCPLNDHGEFVRVKMVDNNSFTLDVTQLATPPIEPTSADLFYVVIG